MDPPAPFRIINLCEAIEEGDTKTRRCHQVIELLKTGRPLCGLFYFVQIP